MNPAPPPAAPKLISVIDIGATAIRMEIAEIRTDGTTRRLDALTRPARLGKDTFTTGRLQRSTIEECVAIFKQFRQTLAEYGVNDVSAVRAVATSAVREAANRDAFLDRVYMATHIPVVCLEDVDLSRLTYLAVTDLLRRTRSPRPWNKLVVEVGGGSTEVLLMQRDQVTFSESYRLGSLRMRETLETYRTAPHRVRGILVQDIRRTVESMRAGMPPLKGVRDLIAVSGDVRFAASRLLPDWESEEIGALSPKQLREAAAQYAEQSADDLVKDYGLTYPEAETLGPALLTYSELVRILGLRRILVPKISLRTALELDLIPGHSATQDFRGQVLHAAEALGQRFHCDPKHARNVADLSLQLFHALGPEHQLGARHELLLEVAALLHECGLFVNNRSHHKHSQYLIMNSDLFGVTRDDLLTISLVARYHRRSPPMPDHPYYDTLPREARIVVQKLAALLRVADALDRVHRQRIREIEIESGDDRVTLTVHGVDDLTIERLALREKGRMFEEIFGKTIVLNQGRKVL